LSFLKRLDADVTNNVGDGISTTES